MKVVITCLFSITVVIAVHISHLEERKLQFQSFKIKYEKSYKEETEETKRFNIFNENLRSIEDHNILYEQGLVSYKKGINKFTDMTQVEFEKFGYCSSSKQPHFNAAKHVITGLPIPDSVDWRKSGQVTGVKNQNNCGSCWAFSVTGSVEAAYFRKSGKLVSFSEQQLVDCTNDINYGCMGGMLDWTFPYVVTNGLQSEESYPYTGLDGSCKYSSSDVVTKISDFKYTSTGNETELLDAVANVGPVSASMFDLFLGDYESGIYDDPKCIKRVVTHAILIVGYGSENGKDFWIVKNSWGENWGEDGYFRIIRGVNECGIGNETAYPIIN